MHGQVRVAFIMKGWLVNYFFQVQNGRPKLLTKVLAALPVRRIKRTKLILMPCTIVTLLSLLLLCSCATNNSSRSPLPAAVSFDESAGRGDLLFVTLRLES